MVKNNNLLLGFSLQNNPRPKNEYIIYNLDRKQTYIETVGLNNFGYIVNDKINWKLLSQKQKYETYDCNIAKVNNYLGRNWTALYDNKILLTNGPYKFEDLPGLILKVYDDKMDYVFSMVKIEKIPYFKIDIDEDFKLISDRQKLKNLKQDFFENPFGYSPNGIHRTIDLSTQREVKERLKKENSNPLELK